MKGSSMLEKVKEIQESISFSDHQYQVVFKTNKGDIRLNLDPEKAPDHCKNLIALAKAGFYNGIIFHRVVPNFVIQAGCPEGNGTGGPGYVIPAEFNDTPHVAGTLSMARTQDPNSAGSQFFLCLGDVPFLNGQYTVFGQTADEESLQVVLEIGQVKTGPSDRPVEDVVINSAEVISQDN